MLILKLVLQNPLHENPILQRITLNQYHKSHVSVLILIKIQVEYIDLIGDSSSNYYYFFS